MRILYHASPEKNLELIKPQPTLSNDKYIGDYVFATKNRFLAVMYLATKGIGILMDTDNAWVLIGCNQDEYIANDKGGAIYIVPGDNFRDTPQEGLSEHEFVSTESVTPIDKTIYDSSLQAMIKNKITVYFADVTTFEKLVKDGINPSDYGIKPY